MGQAVKPDNAINALIVPVLVALITGGFSSYIGVVVAMSVVETKLFYIEADISEITKIAERTSMNQTELVRRGMWIESVEKRLHILENKKPPS